VSAPGLLQNDDDPDGDALTAVLDTGPANGTVTVNADGSFTYTPATDFSGTDSFTYVASDGSLESDPATVTVTVTPDGPPPGGPLIGLGLTEAEDLALAGYAVEPMGGVSGGAVIRTGKDGGTASGTFTGASGDYVIDVTWLNENDGAAEFALLVDGVAADSWTGTGGSGGTGTPTTRSIEVFLETGDTIALEGTQGGFEYARFDSLTVTPDVPIETFVDEFSLA
jgi:hypothetical protein